MINYVSVVRENMRIFYTFVLHELCSTSKIRISVRLQDCERLDLHNIGASDRVFHNFGPSDRVFHSFGVSDRVLHNFGPSNRVFNSFGVSDRVFHNLGPSDRVFLILSPIGSHF